MIYPPKPKGTFFKRNKNFMAKNSARLPLRSVQESIKNRKKKEEEKFNESLESALGDVFGNETFDVGQIVKVERDKKDENGKAVVEDGWEVSRFKKSADGKQVIEVYKEVDGKEYIKNVSIEKLSELNPEGGIEKSITDVQEFFPGVEQVGDSFTLPSPLGEGVSLLYGGEAGEGKGIAVADNEQIGRKPDEPALVQVVSWKTLETLPKSQEVINSVTDSFDDILNALLTSQGVEGPLAKKIKKLAEEKKDIFLLRALGALGGPNPKEYLSKDLTHLVEQITSEKYQDMLFREEVADVLDLRVSQVKAKQEGNLIAATIEESVLADRLESLHPDISPQEAILEAGGWVEILDNPMYQGPKAAEQTRNRLNELKKELRELGAIPPNEMTNFDRMQLTMLWEEKERHEVVLPTLEKFENLQNKVEELQDSLDAKKDKTLSKSIWKGKTFLAGTKKALLSVWGAIGNRTKRINVLEASQKELEQEVSRLDVDFSALFDGKELTPDQEKAIDQLTEARTKVEKLKEEVSVLRTNEQRMKDARINIDFGPDVEMIPEQTALYDHLMSIAKDGEYAAVEQYVKQRLKEKGLSDVERDVLLKVEQDVQSRTWETKWTETSGFQLGDVVKHVEEQPIGKLDGFTADGVPIVETPEGERVKVKQEFVLPTPVSRKMKGPKDAPPLPSDSETVRLQDEKPLYQKVSRRMKGPKDAPMIPQMGTTFDENYESNRARLQNPEFAQTAKAELSPRAEKERKIPAGGAEIIQLNQEPTGNLPDAPIDKNDLISGSIELEVSPKMEAVANELGLTTAELRLFEQYYKALNAVISKFGAYGSKESWRLPQTWNDLLNAKKKSDMKGPRGWLNRFRGKRTMEDIFTSLVASTHAVNEMPRPSGRSISDEDWRTLQDSLIKLNAHVAYQEPKGPEIKQAA